VGFLLEERGFCVVIATDAGAGEEPAEGHVAGGAPLFPGDVAFSVDQDINRVGIGLVHGGEVGVFHQNDGDGAGMLLEVFFHQLFGFADVDGKGDETFVAVFLGNLIDEMRFVGAVGAPGGPEFEEDDFALDAFVGVVDAVGSLSVKARCGLFLGGGLGEAEPRQEDESCGEMPSCEMHRERNVAQVDVSRLELRAR
jgi:hypothetical protein